MGAGDVCWPGSQRHPEVAPSLLSSCCEAGKESDGRVRDAIHPRHGCHCYLLHPANLNPGPLPGEAAWAFLPRIHRHPMKGFGEHRCKSEILFQVTLKDFTAYEYPFVLGLAMAVLFSTLVCLSRLYTGMHTVLDVLGGVLITALLIALTYPAWTFIDCLDSASPLFLVCIIVVPFVLCYNYPVSEYYSPTRADTTTILAAGTGMIIGFWINHFFHLVSKPAEPLPVLQNIPPLTTDKLVLGLAKFTVGIVLILLVRQLVQNLSLQVLFSWFKVVTRNKEARRRLEIEVPYKFVTYTSVGICATTFVPMLHKFLGLL
ncbi:sphingosine-1-phosphate phosphatase 2 isoform X3 [Cavia porcellus]|uniref:sphingosine-1-phosphate phosphatase 2 isoform X3 n=1 Tax=Cavia porcellus TaxID=10141 RepID=UPI0003511D50|nr:sphingosine-1-phosphate phosphatase 2 isoform X2 [Cavia porcellus]